MVKFCYTLNYENLCNKLLNALNGKGAFRKFKDAVRRLNVEKEWYGFMWEAYMKIVKEWCDVNGIKIKNI